MYSIALTDLVTEVCPYCDTEITMRWNIKEQGFKAFCPVCGKILMLCDECFHAEDEYAGKCNWCKDKLTGKEKCYRTKD